MKTKVLLMASLAMLGASQLKAQLNVGSSTAPVASAMLQVSGAKGFLPPAMNTTSRDAITSPATGLMIFNINTSQIETYSGTAWVGATGTSFYTADGTLSSARTVTQGALPLTFNGTGGIVLNSGNVGIGTTTPFAPLQFSNGIVNRKIVLFDGPSSALNDSNFYGLGINPGILRYQVPTGQSHQFFTNKTPVMTIGASGAIYSSGPATGSSAGYYMNDRTRNSGQNAIYSQDGILNLWGIQNGNLLSVDSIGSLKLPKYGLGNFTGTAVNYLAVDAAGKVIEQTLSSGTAPNIYNVDGKISSARIVDMNTFTLGFKGTAGTFTFNNTGNTFSTNASSLAITQSGDAYGPSSIRLANSNGQNGLLVTTGNLLTGVSNVGVTDVFLQTQGGGTGNVQTKQQNLRLESRTLGIFGHYSNTSDTTELQFGKPVSPSLVLGENYVIARTNLGIAMAANDSVRTLLSISPNSPGAKITLFDNGSSTQHFGFGITNGQLNYDVPTGAGGNDHVFFYGGKNGTGTELLRIKSTGNVGVGTAIPASKVDIAGALGFNGATTNGVLKSNAAGVLNLLVGTTSLNIDNNAGSANLLNIINTGNVGIGGVYPNQLLTIGGSGSFGSSSPTVILMDRSYSNVAGQKPKFILFGDTTKGGSYGLGSSNGQLDYIAPAGGAHVFYNNSIENMRVDITGSHLSNANIMEFGYGVPKQGDAGKIGYGLFTANGLDILGGGTSTRTIKLWDNVIIPGTLSVNGVNITSDARLKKDIKNAAYGLDEIMKMRPVTYSYNDNSVKGTQMGFLAQDLEKIIPIVVNKPATAKDFYSVNYTELIPVLTKAIQEQQAQIASLKKENAIITAQLAQVSEMKTAMAEMRKELNKMAVIKVAGSNTASK